MEDPERNQKMRNVFCQGMRGCISELRIVRKGDLNNRDRLVARGRENGF